MLFGQAARLPGTFFFNDDSNDAGNRNLQPVAAVREFQENMRHLQRSSRSQQISNSYVNEELFSVPEILVRDDGNKAPLSKLYTGPFTVIARTDKYFTIDTDRGAKNISIDRLKPFYRLRADENQNQPSTNNDEPGNLNTSDDESSDNHPGQLTNYSRPPYKYAL